MEDEARKSRIERLEKLRRREDFLPGEDDDDECSGDGDGDGNDGQR